MLLTAVIPAFRKDAWMLIAAARHFRKLPVAGLEDGAKA
jgi:hypothetical protein